MGWKHENGTDGTTRMIDTQSKKTAHVLYPFNSSTGGKMKILTAASTLTERDNGGIFFLNATTEFATTLPAPFLGAHFKFMVKGAPSGASYTVVTGSSSNIIVGVHVTAEDAAGSGDSGTADDTITFVDGQAVAGDWVEVISDGTKWYATGCSKVKAGITFTQAST